MSDVRRADACPPAAGAPAAAALANSVASLMEQLVDAAATPHQDIATAMGVSSARVSQLLAGNGNVRISSLGRLVEACGADLRLTVVPRAGGDAITVPRRPRQPRPRGRQVVQREQSGVMLADETAAVESLSASSGAEEYALARASMAAAALSNTVGSLLERVADDSGHSRSAIAEGMGVSRGRVTQILDGDGNVRISTLARVLDATGYDVTLTATVRATGEEITVPRIPSRRRRPSLAVAYEEDSIATPGEDGAAIPETAQPAAPTRAELKARLRLITPLSELVERGDVPAAPLEEQERAVCALLGVATLWDEVPFAAAARRHNIAEPVTAAQRTWLACARKAAMGMDTAPYDREGLSGLATGLTAALRDADGFAHLPATFAAVGVRLVYVAPFRGSKISGAAFLLDGNAERPVIALSGRGKRLDKTLFTLLHEAAHVVLGHPRPETFVIDEDDTSVEPQELAADELASTWLLPSGLSDSSAKVDESWVRAEAERHGVHPAVIVGRLQHAELVPWGSRLARLIPSVEPQLETWHRA